MPDRLKLGYSVPDGDETSVPVFHTVITGITRHGKSETMRAMAQRARDAGYTVLAFDVKNPRDYAGLGDDIPIYLEEHTDPTTLKGLLENQSGMGLNFQFSELIKMYEPGDTYYDMLERMAAAMEEDVHPVEEDKLRVLVHLLTNLTEELDRVAISESLALVDGEINVMDLHEVDDSIQQLAIAGSVQQVLDHQQDTIIILDEAHNFIPQRRQPPARDPLVNSIREGAANNNWVWISDQTITGVDKDPLKQVGVWILGKQREKNEAKRVLDQIPGSTSYGSDDVMTLEKGHFVVALDDAQPLVYVQPTWLDDSVAFEISTGSMDVDSLETPKREANHMDETLQEKETELQEKEQRIRDLEDQLSSKQAEIEALESKVDALFENREEESSAAPPMASIDEETVRQLIQDELDQVVKEYEVPESVTVEANQSAIHVKHTVKPIQVSTDDLLGKVAYLYSEGELPEDKWFTTGDVEKIVQSHGWDDTVKRTSVLDEMCQIGFLEMKFSGRRRDYRLLMDPEEAMEQGLLKINKNFA